MALSTLTARADSITEAPGGRPRPDYRLDEFVLDPVNRAIDRLNIAGSIVGEPVLELTLDGASTITVPVEDSAGRLLQGDFLTGWTWGRNADAKVGRYPLPASPQGQPQDRDEARWIKAGRAISATLDDWPFRLQRIDDDGSTVELVLEDENAAKMRDHRGGRKVYRDNMTRIAFCVHLARSAGVKNIWAPEGLIVQPIERPDEPLNRGRSRSASSRGSRRTRGKLSGPLYGKEGKLGPGQLHNAEVVLDQAYRDKAPTRAILALLIACIQEAPDFKNPTGGSGSSAGILQLLASHGSLASRRDIPHVVHLFLTRGFRGYGGAITLARANPHMSVAEIANRVQGPRDGARVYAPHVAKAKAILAAYSGGGGRGRSGSADTTERTVTKPFALARGRNEHSWDATGRLMEEVAARRFSRAGYVFFVSDAYLWGWPPKFTIAPGMDGVQSIGSEIDLRSRDLVAEVTANVHVDRWEMWPGLVVRVKGKGPADGLWLVQTVRRPLASTLAQVTLRKPVPLKKEPAPETETVRDRASGSSSRVGGSSKLAKAQRLYEICKEFDGPYVYGGGHGGRPLRSLRVGQGLDCSSSVSLALYRVGLFGGRTTAIISGQFSGYGSRGPGKYVTIWYHGGHVYIAFSIPGYNGKRFDTGGPGGGGGPRVRGQTRSHAGFGAVHPPGM